MHLSNLIKQLMPQRPTQANTAFFSTCNNDYIPYSAVSLLSIRKFIPKARLFIFSRDISKGHQNFLRKNHIEYFDIDLRGKFYRHWSYPPECYYLFAGPEKLLEQGFKYSVYIDGDILCLNNPLRDITKLNGIAGAAVGNCRGVFLDDTKGLQELFNLNQKQMNRPRIASGVVYFNNRKMQKIHLLEKATTYFKKCLNANLPRKGDDSLFSLIQLIDLSPLEVKDIPYCNQMLLSSLQPKPSNKDIFFHFTQGKPWNDCGHAEKDILYSSHLAIWREIFAQHFSPTWDKKYHDKKLREQHEIEKSKVKRFKQLSKAGLILPAAKRKANSLKKPLNIFVCENTHLGLTNFGDEVQKDIIPFIFGYQISPNSEAYQASLFSVGSVLFTLPEMNTQNNISVWGSGFISEERVEKEEQILPKIKFYAVRGQLTLKRIQKYTGIQSLPLGDPGILASIIFPENTHKSNKIGVVHHYIDADDSLIETLRHDDRFLIIDPLQTPKEVANQISSCRFIISSSLHGLIFADSYKIPNAHIHFSDKVYGGEYKFRDYDSGVNKVHLEFDIDKIFDMSYIQTLSQQYQPIKSLEKVQKALIESFPHE